MQLLAAYHAYDSEAEARFNEVSVPTGGAGGIAGEGGSDGGGVGGDGGGGAPGGATP